MRRFPVLILFPLFAVLAISTFTLGRKANAAEPQAAAPTKATPIHPLVPIKLPDDAGALSIPDTVSAINADKPMSQRVVHYEIEARYDAQKHSADATETLTYHNLTGQALDHFPFHLYLNGFQPKATWVREGKLIGNRDTSYAKWDDKEYGAEEIKSFEVVGQGDMTQKLQFVQPDDGNKDDKTVMDVHLLKPVAPGGFVQFKIAFHDQFPETQARTGWKRDFILGGQWFPKVGVWWQGAWNCHQFHATTEFFADFGVYDVKLTLPDDEIAGASGVKVSETSNPDHTKTYVYHGDDIHDFAWTASPRYRVHESDYQAQMGTVHLRFLMQPAHWSQTERHEKITRESLDRFEKWYGPYPYKTLTVVDPEHGSAAGGMEYPTFITGESSWYVAPGNYSIESVVEHEFGHQYWYGMVATNEFEDAWMDEGINSYTEVNVLADILGAETSVINSHGATLGDGPAHRLFFLGPYDLDAMAQKGYNYVDFNSYGGITYGKTAEVLKTLEGVVGRETMDRAMRNYFMKYRFTHPTKEDFLKTIEETSGKDLRQYFNQAVYGTQVLDYEVSQADSFPTDWYESHKTPAKKGSKDKTVYQTSVVLHRKGEFVMPVEVEIKFDNGDAVREHWDGVARWTRLIYEKPAQLVSVEIDPDHKIMIDRDNFNNSFTMEGNTKAGNKLTNLWMFITQWLAQAATWFAA